uniref:DUF7597 domain-containing protein n=1 Tax=Setaria viridis TaxID=4556 RepID=A0A4U6VES3_SETVI|nr:hypothetical protein SEVIR_3G297000v2 [Setaria viridis]
MDSSKFNFGIGIAFEKRIQDCLNSKVTLDRKLAGKGFHLLVSFSQNRFHLTSDSVNVCLQSVLGGHYDLFQAEELEDQVFKFTVSSREVGFLIIDRGLLSSDFFKLSFFLLNSIKLYILQRWILDPHTIGMVRHNIPLTGANAIPINNKRIGARPDTPSSNFSPVSAVSKWPKGVGLNWFKGRLETHNGPIYSSPPVCSSLTELGQVARRYQGNVPSATSFPTTDQQLVPFRQEQAPPLLAISGESLNQPTQMAFLNVDPEPLMFPGFNRVLVQGRPKFTRVVTPRSPPGNEDLAIVTVSNFPPGEIPFADVQNAVVGLIEDELELHIQEIQRCPFHRAQAFIRLNRATDRDALVQHSPFNRNGLSFSFVHHNRGPNARRVLFNRECWLLLIGYPLDSRNLDDIRDAIKSFGRLICWQKDNIMARVVVKARVTDLEDVPHYLIFSEGDDFEGVSTTVQVEIMQQNPLGGFLQDEDIPPPRFEDNFIFPGFHNQPQQHEQHLQNHHQQHEQHLLEQAQNNQQVDQLPDLNEDPDEEEHIQEQMQMLMDDLQDQAPEQGDIQHEEGQIEMDLQLSLSAPLNSSSTEEGSDKQGKLLSEDTQQNEGQEEKVQVQEIVLAIPAIQNIQGHQPGQANNEYMMVEALPNSVADPGWADWLREGKKARSTSPDLQQLWDRFFTVDGSPEKVITLPNEWAPFFTFNLLNSNKFEWACSFLSSKASQLLLTGTSNSKTVTMSIPKSCPKQANIICSSSPVQDQVENRFNSDSNSRGQKKTKVSAPLVETEARRSPRIRTRNAGFKHSSCTSRNCLACAAVPPSLPTKTLVALGEDFYKVSKGTLSNEKLRRKIVKVKVIGDKEGTGSKKNKKDEMSQDLEEGECSGTGSRS